MASKPIDLGEAQARAGQDPIWTWRGHAIGAYAVVEQSLCQLLAAMGGMQSGVAGIIFFKITNADARNSILEKLIKKKHGSTYNLFWNSYFTQLRRIDRKRNEIVHWAAISEIKSLMADSFDVEVTFRPGNFADTINQPDQTKLTASDLIDFISKCDVLSRICNIFVMFDGGYIQGHALDKWRDIFLQPLAYPVPDSHPISRNYKEPGSQPPPSQA